MTREPAPFTVFGFETTHRALDAEALLRDMGVQVIPVPAPKQLGAQCGIGLRVPEGEAERAQELLERAELAWSAMVSVQDV